jgi:plasmid stability protein
MRTITLKNIPEQLYQRLKQRATQHRRSLNSEIITSLERVAGNSRVDPDGLLARARALRGKISGRLTDKDLPTLKNRGRP